MPDLVIGAGIAMVVISGGICIIQEARGEKLNETQSTKWLMIGLTWSELQPLV